MEGFEQHAAEFFERHAVFADHPFVQPASRIGQQPRFGRPGLHAAAAARGVEVCGPGQFARLAAQDPADRETPHDLQLRVGRVYGVVDAVRSAHVEGRILHRQHRSVRHVLGRVPEVAVGFDLHHVIHHIAAVLPFEIEIGVVREVDDRRTVGLGLVFDAAYVVFRPPVGDRAGEVARIALLAVGAQAREPHAGPVGFEQRFAPPHHAVESLRSAVQVARTSGQTLVGGEPHGVAVERERGIGDAVAVAADQGPEEAFASGLEVADVVVSRHDVGDRAVAVGNADPYHAAAVVDDLHRGAVTATEPVEGDLLAGREPSERGGFHGGRACGTGGQDRRRSANGRKDDSFHG